VVDFHVHCSLRLGERPRVCVAGFHGITSLDAEAWEPNGFQ